MLPIQGTCWLANIGRRCQLFDQCNDVPSQNHLHITIDMLCRLDSKHIVLSALWDLITLQCDRHGQNVFIDDSATLTLIDLDQALGDAWRKCAFDSIFLPTSQKHAITNLGFWFTMKLPSDNPPKEPGGLGIQHVMDYRCHAPGGKIGRDYTQKFEQCLKRISSSTYRQVGHRL